MDAIYTPPSIAEEMISFIDTEKNHKVIADFSCGSGELLRAAKYRWPKSICIGTDIDKNIIMFHKRNNSDWHVGVCNYLNKNSRSKNKLLNQYKGDITLAVLNPPFSYRGAANKTTIFKGEHIKSSISMAFILNAVAYLKSDAEIISILPAGSITSEKDIEAWNILEKYSDINILRSYHKRTFSNCYPESIIVCFKLRKKPNIVVGLQKIKSDIQISNTRKVKLIRGTLQMHTIQPEQYINRGIPLIHSTDLINGDISLKNKIRSNTGRKISGPAVLLVRVGKPDATKICVYDKTSEVFLSDCVIAIKTKSLRSAKLLHEECIANWHQLEKTYGGTCAKYTTIFKLNNFLEDINYKVE